MKKEAIVLTVFIFSLIIFISFISADFVDDTTTTQNVTDCGTLNTTDGVYTLNQSLNSSFSCIIINASNITLNCAGYNITYGNATGGFGILISGDDGETGYDNITIQNCIVVQNESGGDDAAIRFGAGSENGVAYNNTLLIYGIDTVGIMLEDNSINANISSNNITASGNESTAIILSENGTSADVRNNVVTTSGNDSSGIKISDNSSSNLIYNNTITTSGDWSATENTTLGGIFLEEGSFNVNVSSNNITMAGYNTAGIWIWGSNHSVDNNTITTSGEWGDGIYMSDGSGTNLTSNTIAISGNASYGIYSIMSENSSLLFYNNVITTSANYSYGIHLQGDSNNNISSNNITTSGNISYGIFTNESHNSTITNNIIKTGTTNSYTLYLITSSNQSIYNNIFNTSTTGSGVYVTNSNLNYFNSSSTPATNIVGSASYGGNFWTNTNGNGYSDYCANTEANYYCDSTYLVESNGPSYDYLPLTNYQTNISTCATLNVKKRYDLNQSLSSNGTCFNITANGITLDFAGFTITGNTTDYGINISGYNSTTVLNGTISNFSTGIYLSSSSSNSFTSISVNNSKQDAIILAGATSYNNNFTSINPINTNSSHYDINFSTAGIDGTWIEGINFANYTFAGVGGKVNFKKPSFGEIVFLEAINRSGTDLHSDVNIENNSVFVNSSSNSGLNKSANISFYTVSFTNPKPQYSYDNSTWTDCTTTTNPTCVEFSYTEEGTFKFNVSHFTYFKIIETPSTAEDDDDDTTTGGGGTPTYRPTKEQLVEGYARTLSKNTKVKFNIEEEAHELKIDSINNTKVQITVTSEPQTKILEVGDEAKFELTGDNIYDFSAKVELITGTRAKLLMKTISEKIPASEINDTQSQEANNGTQEDEDAKEKTPLHYYWIIILIILIIIAVSFYYYYKKRK